jgi:hypothetical protein
MTCTRSRSTRDRARQLWRAEWGFSGSAGSACRLTMSADAFMAARTEGPFEITTAGALRRHYWARMGGALATGLLVRPGAHVRRTPAPIVTPRRPGHELTGTFRFSVSGHLYETVG